MAKRKCEQPPMAVLPPCKRPQCEPPLYSRHCTLHTGHGAPKRKRKPELVPTSECDRPTLIDGTAAVSPPPGKKRRPSESQVTEPCPEYKCQEDEAFQEYNSFHFWKNPLPEIDLSELVDETCDGDTGAVAAGTDVLEDMDG